MYKKAWCTCEVVVVLIKPIVFLTFSLSSASLDLKVPNRGLKQRGRRRQRQPQKTNRFNKQKQLYTCSTLFCTFLCRRCTTTTWNCLISRFVEDVDTGKRPSVSFPELWYSPLEFNSRKICQHLTNWMRWEERDKVWRSANSLFLKVTFSWSSPSSLLKLPNYWRLHVQHTFLYISLPPLHDQPREILLCTFSTGGGKHTTINLSFFF